MVISNSFIKLYMQPVFSPFFEKLRAAGEGVRSKYKMCILNILYYYIAHTLV